MGKTIRILIADDHAVVRRGLILVLKQEPDFEVVGEAKNGIEAIQMAGESRPDLALLDWKMPEMDGLQAAGAIKRAATSVRTLLLSGAPVEAAVLDALENGVDGFVHKDITPAGLAHAIRVVAGGRNYLGPEIAKALIARSRQAAPAAETNVTISPREMDVLKLMSTPATYRDIAVQLSISETTVRTHVKRILAKLNQPNRTQAVVAALRLGMISFE
jgi:DNA-binding NarL/FixJ family response regulator